MKCGRNRPDSKGHVRRWTVSRRPGFRAAGSRFPAFENREEQAARVVLGELRPTFSSFLWRASVRVYGQASWLASALTLRACAQRPQPWVFLELSREVLPAVRRRPRLSPFSLSDPVCRVLLLRRALQLRPLQHVRAEGPAAEAEAEARTASKISTFQCANAASRRARA
jgi:hypothetical protein